MDRLRDELLTGAALAGAEPRAVRRSDAHERIEDLPDGGRVADHAGTQRRGETTRDLRTVRHRRTHLALEIGDGDRLLPPGDRAETHRLDAGRDRTEGSQDEDGNAREDPADRAHDGETVAVRHAQVGDDHVETAVGVALLLE